MKLLILVLTYDEQLYNFFDNIKEKYLLEKKVDFKFLYNGMTDINSANRINYRTDEGSIPAMLKKFINYIEHDRDYDFIIKMNSSTFINIDKIIEIIDHNQDDLYMGFFEQNWNFCSGALTIFSKGVLEKIIQNKDRLAYDIEDDVAIGNLLNSIGVSKTFLDRYNISDRDRLPDIDEIQNALNYPQIRIRNDINRDVIDKGIWNMIKQELNL